MRHVPGRGSTWDAGSRHARLAVPYTTMVTCRQPTAGTIETGVTIVRRSCRSHCECWRRRQCADIALSIEWQYFYTPFFPPGGKKVIPYFRENKSSEASGTTAVVNTLVYSMSSPCSMISLVLHGYWLKPSRRIENLHVKHPPKFNSCKRKL